MKGRSIKNSQVPGRGGWFVKHQQKEAIAEPPMPPVGVALRARLESQVPGICAGAMLYCLVRQIRPKDMRPLPSLPTSSGFFQEMETFKMDEDKALGYTAAV